MKRKLAIFAQVALAVSAVCFASALYRFNDWNWRPVVEPFPGPGFEVASAFQITSTGKYRVEVLVPAKTDKNEVAMRTQPPIPCNILLSLDGPDGFRVEQTITQLTHSGRYYFGETDIYDTEPIEVSTTGSFTIHILNKGELGALGQKGAMLQFTQFEHPTEFYLLSALVRSAGWFFLSVGFVAGIVSWKPNE